MDVSFLNSSVIVQAPAKLNLFLEVIAKRSDGYHEIETLMTAITLYDTVVIARNRDKSLRFDWRWAGGVQARQARRARPGDDVDMGALPRENEENIVWRAARTLQRRAGGDEGATIRLIKRIPTQAGLGGASSDAAAALVGLNHVWQLGWTASRLAEVGGELGSDVPFFLAAGARGAGMAVCRGRGEQIEPVAAGGRLHFVIVRPPRGLATAAVYQACRPGGEPRTSAALLRTLQGAPGPRIGALLFNRLQVAAETLAPWVGEIRARFERLDCWGHQMSGSGSSYFGVCRSARHARRLAGFVRGAGLGQVFRAETATRQLAVISA